jgi:uncharacterized membrane protein YobD (UPF0266 family)
MTEESQTPEQGPEVKYIEATPLEQEEAKLQHFILQNLAMLDSFQDPNQKAHEIVKAFKFYFTQVYKDYAEAEEVRLS